MHESIFWILPGSKEHFAYFYFPGRINVYELPNAS